MARSMTGFASRIITLPIGKHSKVSVALTLKSLNSRFFDTTCKLPYPLSNLETEFIKIFKQALHRGYVHFTVHMGSTDVFKGTIEPSLETIKGYVAAVEKIKETVSIEGSFTVSDLLELPGVFNTYEQDIDEQVKDLIMKTTQDLIKSLITTQETEGKALVQDMQERIKIITNAIQNIEKTFENVMKEQKARIQESLKEISMDESKLAEAQKTSLYTLLDKLDIHEEIVRFKAHIKALETELQSASIEKGKRLDFILQELAREINTISAKCPDSSISNNAINIRVELEKVREQTQNLV